MKLKQTVLVIALFISVCTILVAPFTSADCGGVKTSLINCSQTGGPGSTPDKTGVWGILLLAINILSAGVGIAAVGGVVYGSIMYTTSGGNVEQTKKARTIIANTVIGIIMYVLLYAFLNYLIPGGIFS